MNALNRFGAVSVAASLVVALGLPASAAAKPKGITGTLSEPGYTVIAMAAGGKVRTERAPTGRFTLRPPAKRVTLHLRAEDGTYAGPVVVATRNRGHLAVVGVRAGARLGAITVSARGGYAKVRRKLPKSAVDLTQVARAKKGTPIGAGNFGRVRVRRLQGPNPDADLDGIPYPLDIDDDGDLILDNLDRRQRHRAVRAQNESSFNFWSTLAVSLDETANVDAGSTDAEIDATLPRRGTIGAGIRADAAELDCGGTPNPSPPPALVGGLPYCSSGGTGEIGDPSDTLLGSPFPGCCDADNDGFGALRPLTKKPGVLAVGLLHRATSAQIGTGDLLTLHVTRDAVETELTATVQFIYATVPALASYSDGQGNSVTPSYPIASNGPGTQANPFPVTAGPNGDVVLTLTFWRPQRRPIPPEQGEWIDIGGLTYDAFGLEAQSSGCPQDSYATDDPNLSLTPQPDEPENPGDGMRDLADDGPTSPANTFTYRLNLTHCLAVHQVSFNPGETRTFGFRGHTANEAGESAGLFQLDETLVTISFRRAG